MIPFPPTEKPVVGPTRSGGLKARVGGDIGIHGSITLAQSLLAAGLVDELQLAVGPVLDPMGRRLFTGLGDSRQLELQSATLTPGGTVWITYRVP